VVEGNEAIEGCRATNGATNPIKAIPGTIRGDFGQSMTENLVHASDSPESAKREIAIWFESHELCSKEKARDCRLVGA
jgi:nucleoside-diphosphate kinase